MKNSFTLRLLLTTAILFTLFSENVNAQASSSNYTFSTVTTGSLALDANGNTVDMSTGTTQLVAGSADQTASSVTTIGFPFILMGNAYTQFSATSNGLMALGSVVAPSSTYTPSGGTTTTPLISAFGGDLQTGAAGKVHFKLIGSAPNRCLVVEYLNMSIYYDATSSDGTFQVRLYETSGRIEFVYGAMSVSITTANLVGSITPAIGFVTNPTATNFAYVTVSSNTATTSGSFTANPSSTVGTITNLNSSSNGSRRVYTFTPQAAPTAPTSLNFTSVTQTATTLNWTDNASNELGYAIFRSDDGGTTYNYISTVAANTTTSAQTGLSISTTYFWRVCAFSEGALSSNLQGSQATSAAGEISSTGAGGVWSSTGTWVGGVIPTSGDNVTIVDGATVTIDATAVCNALTVGQGTSGILQFEQTTARTITVSSNVTIAAGGTFQSNTAGTQTGHALSLGGSLTNNGTLDFSTNTNTAKASITFTGSANTTFGGSGATTDINTLTVNKGTSSASILDVTLTNGFTISGANTAGFLSLTNGTFKISGSFTQSSIIFSSTSYSIASTAGLWLNNSNFTVTGQNGNPTWSGLVRITNGTFNVSTATGALLAPSASSVVTIEGGSLNIAGRFNSSSTYTYTQSGGTVTVNTAGNSTTSSASFGITSSSSTFTMSGGTIVLQLASTGGTPFDYDVTATPTITGGTLQLGNAASGVAKTYSLRGNAPNVVVTNTSANHIGRFISSGTLTVYGDLTINSGATFTNATNSGTLVMAGNATNVGNIVNAGTLTLNSTTSGGLTFSSSTGNQSISGAGTFTSNTVAGALTINNTFSSGTVTFPADVTLSSGASTSITLNLTAGTLNNNITIGGGGTSGITCTRANGTVSGTITNNVGSGTKTYTYNQSTSAVTIGGELAAGATLNSFTINNTSGVTMDKNFTVATTLTLTAGALSHGTGTLTLGASGTSTTLTISRAGGSLTNAPTFSLSGVTTLNNTYTAPSPAASITTGNELPSGQNVTTLTINNTSGVTLNNSINITGTTGGLTLTSGILSLGNFDLSLGNSTTVSGTPSVTNMVATTGTGQLKKSYNATGSFTFPVGDVTGTNEYSPATINFTALTTTPSVVGIKVTDAQHPSDASVADFLSRYWSFTESGSTAYTYTATFTYPSGEVTGSSSNMRLFARNGGTWTSIGSTPSATSMSNLTSLTNVTMPINSTDFTGRTFAGAITYVWNQAADAAYNVTTNWTPTRTSPDPADILQFTNNATYNVTALPTETIGKLEVSGTTNVTLQSGGSVTLTINGGTGDDLRVGTGSSLVIGGSNSIAFAFAASTTSQIDGTLEVQLSRTYTATNGVTTVGSGGIFKNAGTVTSTASNLIFGSGGKYQHNNTTTAGTIPTATWNAASTLEFIGYTTNVTAPSNISQTFGNITWNCASQTAVAFSLAAVTLTSTGTFTMTSTGLGSFVLSASSSAGNLVCVNYVHNGGTLNFNSSTGSSLVKVSGTLTYAAGTITETGSGTLNAFELNGSSTQSIPSFTLTNDIGYRINNAAGVNIGDGSGTLTLNASAPIIMVSGAITGTITYGATGILVYNGATAQTATATEFPNSNGPFSLTINNSTGVTIPFSRSVGGTLTMTIGNILIGANTLTLGTSATVVGTLTYTAGFIVPTSGSFARWYGASGAPTSSATTSRFPMGTSTSDNRFVHIFPSSATSFSGGGGVFAVSHTSTAGVSTVADFTDNTITINRRSNSSWTVTTPVLPVLSSGSISVTLQATNAVGSTTSGNLRLVGASASVTGGSSTGSGTSPDFVVTKPTIAAISDLTAGALYVGGNSTNLFGIITAIATGNWGDASTWNTNAVPTSSDNVTIPNTFNVTMASGTPPYAANNVTINTGGTLTSNANTLVMGITNGGAVTLAANGNLSIGGGTIEVNGNVLFGASSNFTQSAGNLKIDGNDGVSAATSVVNGTNLFGVTSGAVLNCSGGTVTIVDPPFSTTTTSLAVSIASALTNKTYFSGTHTFVFGDGVSTTPGSTTNGFIIDNFVSTGKIALNNVTVNAGNGSGRFVRNTTSTSNGTYIYGTLTINAGSEFRFITNATDDNVLGGNLVNNGTFSQTSTAFIMGAVPSTSGLEVTTEQTISGSGVFQNATSSPTANFASLTINNGSSTGVIISSSTALSGTGTGTVSGILTMTSGILNVGSNTITVGISTASTGTLTYTAGQIIGKLKRWKATGTGSLAFNLGNSTAEQRATINFTTGPTTGGSITGEFINSNPAGTQPALVEGAITVDRAAGTGYWSFTTGDAFAMGAGAYTGTFIAKSFAGVSDFSKLVAIQRTDGASAWTLNGTHATTTGSNATATLSRTLMTAFGHIGVGGTLADNPLPIELLKFTGFAKPDFNVLTWTTASEINSSHFDVERLNSDKVFENIATVTAAGNSREINQYQFHDATFTKTNAIEYYRLKMVDRDDHFKYSDVIAVKRNEDVKASVSLYPNPSSELVNIIISNADVTKIQVRVLDVVGKIIYENNNLMSNEINSIPVADFPSGIYTLQVIGLTENINQKFIKK